ncbi:MAG: hypothetical protein GY863_06795 [bacterium]|nr:hypothetical protein [bacterium]
MRLPKNRFFYMTVVLLLTSFFNFKVTQDHAFDFSRLSGHYLGQKPPGMEPELFAKGIISTNEAKGSSVFSLNADMFIFRKSGDRSREIFITRMINGKWSQPVQVPWDSKFGESDFTIAPDGKTVYFASRRPVKGETEPSTEASLWKTAITENEWSEPVMIGNQANTKYHESYPSLTSDGIMYFFSRRPGVIGKSDIYFSKRINGKYLKAVNMGNIINTEYDEWDPYIAPDESYLIFCSTKPGSLGKDDLYISFRSDEDSWTKPVHMGNKINSPGWENRPYVTLDGKYLFFTSDRSGRREIYWIDAGIIEKFKPDNIR